MNEACIILYSTVPSIEIAKKIATVLVDKQLVACVNILPNITSIYKWEGSIHTDSELLLMMKTRHVWIERITNEIKLLHPYHVPEIIATNIIGGNQMYMDWILKSTSI